MSERATEIKRMLPRHFQILDLTLEGLGRTEIAGALGMTRETVQRVVASPVFQHELARRREKREGLRDQNSVLEEGAAIDRARMILEEALPKAAQTHVGLLDNDDPAIAQRSANSILDRAMGTADKTGKGGGPQITIHADQVQLLQTAFAESRTDPMDT